MSKLYKRKLEELKELEELKDNITESEKYLKKNRALEERTVKNIIEQGKELRLENPDDVNEIIGLSKALLNWDDVIKRMNEEEIELVKIEEWISKQEKDLLEFFTIIKGDMVIKLELDE